MACASRREVRDYYDVCSLAALNFPMLPCLWAACAKDLGFTPHMILDQMAFHSHYTQSDFKLLDFGARTPPIPGHPLSPVECKKAFLGLMDAAQKAFSNLPITEAGILYINKDSNEAFIPTADDFKHNRTIKNAGGTYGVLQLKPDDNLIESLYSLNPLNNLRP
ncbi:MAG: hypothetical protein LBP33_03520 [Candidatus Adiutrix sp.]|jgi:hypothetical protein|nr:hypothetical protein [Candidatus Adiutrix sp.]